MAFGTILGQSPMDTNVYLSNDVITVLQLQEGATLEEALLVLGLSSLNGTLVKINVIVGGNVAKAGILLNGITDINGEPCITDTRGSALGLYTGGEASFSISSQEYADIPSISVQVQSDRTHIQYATLALPAPITNTGNYITVNGPANQSIWFSPYVTGVDVHVIDGGKNGNRGSYSYPRSTGGSGGAGGSQGYKNGIKPWTTTSGFALNVGGAGEPSTFMNVAATLPGGAGGVGGRSVHDDYADENREATKGGNNTTKLFGTGSIIGSGGGGGGGAEYYRGPYMAPANGGSVGGGRGGYTNSDGTDARNGGSGTAPGAGGGGGGSFCNYGGAGGELTNAGSGSPGAVYYRWRVESV